MFTRGTHDMTTKKTRMGREAVHVLRDVAFRNLISMQGPRRFLVSHVVLHLGCIALNFVHLVQGYLRLGKKLLVTQIRAYQPKQDSGPPGT